MREDIIPFTTIPCAMSFRLPAKSTFGQSDWKDAKQKIPQDQKDRGGFRKMATTYSPTFYRSTISAGGLNFSVRNGKR
jgi:hypothetical protein